jgi:hypothetical protein
VFSSFYPLLRCVSVKNIACCNLFDDCDSSLWKPVKKDNGAIASSRSIQQEACHVPWPQACLRWFKESAKQDAMRRTVSDRNCIAEALRTSRMTTINSCFFEKKNFHMTTVRFLHTRHLENNL